MNTVRITKEFSFEMAHALFGHDGSCKNIHGHSYKLSVTIKGKPINKTSNAKNGMVMDFSDLKQIVAENILTEFDHALVLNGNSPHKKILKDETSFNKIIYTEYQPTCENLLLDFRKRIHDKLNKELTLQYIKLRETESSYAEWFLEDNFK